MKYAIENNEEINEGTYYHNMIFKVLLEYQIQDLCLKERGDKDTILTVSETAEKDVKD